jgi:hypothetical protein
MLPYNVLGMTTKFRVMTDPSTMVLHMIELPVVTFRTYNVLKKKR